MSCRTQSSSAEQYCRLGHTYQFYCFASATFSICVRAVGRSLLVSCVIVRLVLSNSSAVTKSGRVIAWKAVYYSWGGRSQRKRALMRNVKSGLPITFSTPTQEASVHVGSPIGISRKFYLDWSSKHFTNTFTITCWICSGQFPGSWSAFCCLQFMALNPSLLG